MAFWVKNKKTCIKFHVSAFPQFIKNNSPRGNSEKYTPLNSLLFPTFSFSVFTVVWVTRPAPYLKLNISILCFTRRGYQVYKQVCAACHSMRFLAYRYKPDQFFIIRGIMFDLKKIGEIEWNIEWKGENLSTSCPSPPPQNRAGGGVLENMYTSWEIIIFLLKCICLVFQWWEWTT